MRLLTFRAITIPAILVLTATSATALQGCDDPTSISEGVCGDCGDITTGQVSISGNARLDGFFQAVADLRAASATVRADFDTAILALAEVYGMGEGTVDADFVGDLVTRIRADIDANVQGTLTLDYQPPTCSASVEVAVEAQAQCEASAGCNVDVDPGMVAVECMGECTGSCEGGCEGNVSCTPPGGSVECDVGCEGTCAIEGSAACEGTCRGECDGECSLVDGEGNCAGRCDGMCSGTCEISGSAECEGTCHGTCHASVTPPECEGSIRCEGTCMGMCTGGCQGEFEPPSASADCDATAECQAQASARADANVSCTPPSLDLRFDVDSSLDANARAEFLARMDLVRVRLAAALQAAARARVLVQGSVSGDADFEASAVGRVLGQIQGLVSAGIEGDFDIPAGRLPCVIPALQTSVTSLGEVRTDLEVVATGSADLFGFVADPT